ncbi:hypothetical protein CRUP_009472 [Coryphaenoides rupestris]|nr:hypothetical protein CRUP_009472 [Coryphaenoides rupestris]
MSLQRYDKNILKEACAICVEDSWRVIGYGSAGSAVTASYSMRCFSLPSSAMMALLPVSSSWRGRARSLATAFCFIWTGLIFLQ